MAHSSTMRQLKITKQVTNRETISLDKYLSEISKVDLINSDEEVELARRIKAGDQQALERLTRANLRFVVSVAKQYQHQGLGLSDLINEGNVGLIKAAQRFDETRGFKFISYAVWWIRQSILQALAEQSRIVRLPLNKISSISKVNKFLAQLEQEFERLPSDTEMADAMDLNVEDIREARTISHRPVSMEESVTQDEDSGNLYDLLISEEFGNPDKGLINDSLKKEIERSLSSISEREANIIRMFYGIGMKHALSLEEIADNFGLTRERVRQIREKGIRRLKHTSRSKLLKAYLG